MQLKYRHFVVALCIALLGATGIASAGCYIDGLGALVHSDKNLCAYRGHSGFFCDLKYKTSTIVTFLDEKQKNGCSVTVLNNGSMFTGANYYVTPAEPRGWAKWTCHVKKVHPNYFQVTAP